MTPAFRLWRELTAEGVTLAVVGKNLRYAGPKRTLTDKRKGLMKRYKRELVKIVDNIAASEEAHYETAVVAAREAGWLVLNESSAYSMQLSKSMMVFLLRDADGTWCVWRGNWRKGDVKPFSQNILDQGLSFEEALERGNAFGKWFRGKQGVSV